MSSVPHYGRYRVEGERAPKPTRTAKRTTAAKVRRPVQRRAAPKTGSVVLQFVAVGAIAALATFGFSVLMGRSMAERASREIGKYHIKAKVARAETEIIKQRLDIRINPKKVKDWAENNGFTKAQTGALQQ